LGGGASNYLVPVLDQPSLWTVYTYDIGDHYVKRLSNSMKHFKE